MKSYPHVQYVIVTLFRIAKNHMRKVFNIIIYFFAIIGFILLAVYIANLFGWTKTDGIIDNQHDYFKNQVTESTKHPSWSQTEEWSVLKEAILKDKAAIISASDKTRILPDKANVSTSISPRLITAVLIVEQLRLFHSNREIFKQIFAPLKILGNQSQFSWGVMGIKQDTAREIESNLKDSQSPWYLGKEYEHLLDYASSTKTSEVDAERFARLTNENDRYFSYLYSAVLLKELQTQWERAGFPISDKPEVLATLFNIGFNNSRPNANPKSGGAQIDIGTTTYSFGSLAGSFYYSDELLNEFPR